LQEIRVARDGPIAVRFAGPPLATIIAIVAAGGAAHTAEDDFYSGRQLRLIISSGPAGVYDTFGRLLARFLPTHLPGRPTIVVQNMPGASGIRATN